MTMTTLYAWAAPAFVQGAPVDHTWITDFDIRLHDYPALADVAAAGLHSWQCWGSYHSAGGTPPRPDGFLLKEKAGLKTAICLVKPNADSRHDHDAQGTVSAYGVNGVCHQVANQVLYACGHNTRVRDARGYGASSFLYGDYGLRDEAWASKTASCGPFAAIAKFDVDMAAKDDAMGGGEHSSDDFETRARAALGETDPERLQSLLALRADARKSLRAERATMAEADAATLNARNQKIFDQAAKLLTPEQFREIFGFEPGETINLVVEQTSGATRL